MATAEQLLELQVNDTAIDQLRFRMPRLPEVVAATAATAEVSAWEKRATELRSQIEGFERAIANSESASGAITVKRDRLEKQLKTVIASREAEALMHEIAGLNAQRSALDDDELEAMDGLARAEDELREHATLEARLREVAAETLQAAEAARAAAEAELAEREATRDVARAAIDAATLSRYDSMRSTHDGVAVARLAGLHCEGCHLDMSRAEADDIKRLPPGELAECPNCGRLLVN